MNKQTNKTETITLYKGNNNHNIQFVTKHIFFNKPVIITAEEGFIVFRHSTIDDSKGVINPSLIKKTKYYHFHYTFYDYDIELKKYNLETEDEDELYIEYI